MNIQILPSSQINTSKWDACVSVNRHGLIYATTAYLNAMADNWSGLVINDYEAIMALPWRRKWGIKYLYTVPFTQQLGLIGADFNASILQEINKFSRYGDYFLNASNKFPVTNGTIVSNCNLILDLSKGYDAIRENYSNELIGYLKKANGFLLSHIDSSVLEAVDAYQKHYQERMPHLQQSDFDNFKMLVLLLKKEGGASAKSVIDKEGKQLAIGLFLKDNKRIYNLMPTTFPDGRTKLAMHFLLDNVFKEYANSQIIFDFEGSDLSGVKKFYKQFGSINEPYFHWHSNNLPWPLRLIKK